MILNPNETKTMKGTFQTNFILDIGANAPNKISANEKTNILKELAIKLKELY